MTYFLLLINVFFVWFFWRSAGLAFEEGRNVSAYIDLTLSAMNFALILNLIL